MSFKAKDLAYEANEPSFLRKLRAGVASGDTDRHERPIARPQRLKRDEDEDDGPTYVLEESGESMSKAEYEARQRGEEQGGEDRAAKLGGAEQVKDEGEDVVKGKGHDVEIGLAQRKRKAGKIIGDGGDDGKAEDEEAKAGARKTAKKSAKKAKAVKLSFDED